LSPQYLVPGEAAEQSFAINYSKLALEPPRPFLPRPRLLQLLGRGPQPRVVSVCAPAGSGKSTLIYELLVGSDCPVVYYRLNHADADVPQFVSYLTAGICQHEPGFGAKVKAFLADSHDISASWTSLVEILLHEISRIRSRGLWIVLDDYQQVEGSPNVPSIVAELGESLPAGTRLIVASRGLPALPLSRWRVRGDLLELGPGELAFSWIETQRFFHEVTGVPLDEESLRSIHFKTEGWAAGLALAAQIARLHSPEDTVRIVEGVGGSGSPIYDYLAEQVYRKQPPPVMEFLRRSSILKYLSSDLCNALLGIQNAGAMLYDLYRAGLFLQPVQKRGRQFRYHQLFREFLLSKLKEEETPDAVRKLRTMAGRGLEAERSWNEAILQYATGGDVASAVALVVRFGEHAIESGRVYRVSRWLRELPEEAVEGQPKLLMLKGLVALGLGDTSSALQIFERCTDGLRDRPDPVVRAKVAKHTGVAHYRQGRYGDAIRVLKEAIDVPDADLDTRIDLRRGLGVAYCGAGQLERAERQESEVLRALQAHSRSGAHDAAIKVAALRNLARVKLLGGDLNAALDLAREAVRVSETENAGEYQQMQAFCILGAVLAADGNFAEAVRVLEQARSKGAGFYPRDRAWVAGWLGNVYRDSGELARAKLHYDNADGRFDAERAFLLLRMGNLQESLRIAQDATASRISLESPPDKAHAQVAYALGLDALGLREAAVQTLESAADVLQKHGYAQRYASACMRIAELWRAMGEGQRCRLWLQRWLGFAREHGLCHFQWWDPQVFVSALTEAFRQRVDVQYAIRLAVRRLQPEELDALREWIDGGQTGTPCIRPRDASTTAAFMTSPEAGPDLEQAIASCRDPQVRVAVREALDRGLVTDGLLARLRGPFQLTWKEVLIFLSYYLQAAYQPSTPETRLRARIADELCISENTLKCHVASIRRKLGLPHRIGSVGLLSWGVEHGILSPAAVPTPARIVPRGDMRPAEHKLHSTSESAVLAGFPPSFAGSDALA